MAMTTAAVVSAGASAYGATRGKSGSRKVKLPPWLNAASEYAVQQARGIASRPWQGYGGERVAQLGANERLAGRMARTMGNQLRPFADRLSRGFTSKALSRFENPYLDRVLENQRRVIGEEYGRLDADLSRRQSAMDAYGTGRSALARSRLNDYRMRALGDAEAQGRASAFDRALDAYFKQGAQDLGAMGAIGQLTAQQIEMLSKTGLTERSVRQAEDDFDYGQFLEQRDWSVTNLAPLLNAIQAARGDTKISDTEGGADKWDAYGGLISALANIWNKQG